MLDYNGDGYEVSITDEFGSAGGPEFASDVPFTNDAGPDGLWPSTPPYAGDVEDPPPMLPPPVLDLQPVPVPPPNIGNVLNGLGAGTILLGAVAIFFLLRGRRR